ncbi:hypothetical protein ACFLRF_01325 [Candidatus Altiarchaeota archaeon]
MPVAESGGDREFHPPVILDASKLKAFSFTDLTEAKKAAGVESVMPYSTYEHQANGLLIPLRPATGLQHYFGVNASKHSKVFTRGVDGRVSFEPGCGLHVCDPDALVHQMQTGEIASGGIRSIPGYDDFSQSALGPFVQLGVPPMITDVASGEVGGPTILRTKSMMGVMFVHVIAPSDKTEVVMRSGYSTPDHVLGGGFAEHLAKWMTEGQQTPDASTTLMVRKVPMGDVKATIIAHPTPSM